MQLHNNFQVYFLSNMCQEQNLSKKQVKTLKDQQNTNSNKSFKLYKINLSNSPYLAFAHPLVKLKWKLN